MIIAASLSFSGGLGHHSSPTIRGQAFRTRTIAFLQAPKALTQWLGLPTTTTTCWGVGAAPLVLAPVSSVFPFPTGFYSACSAGESDKGQSDLPQESMVMANMHMQ